jgi:hypothetical protein
MPWRGACSSDAVRSAPCREEDAKSLLTAGVEGQDGTFGPNVHPWVPRTGYAQPTPALLVRILARPATECPE